MWRSDDEMGQNGRNMTIICKCYGGFRMVAGNTERSDKKAADEEEGGRRGRVVVAGDASTSNVATKVFKWYVIRRIEFKSS